MQHRVATFGRYLLRRSAGLITVAALALAACVSRQPAPVEVTRLVMATEVVPVTVEVTRLASVAGPVTPTVDIASQPFEVGSLTGHYAFASEGSQRRCLLAVIHRALKASHAVEFELSCNTGEPSFNIGYLTAVVPMVDGAALFAREGDGAQGSCHLTIDFFPEDGARVVQYDDAAACGFGHGVDATGHYLKVDGELPTIGCLRPDHACP